MTDTNPLLIEIKAQLLHLETLLAKKDIPPELRKEVDGGLKLCSLMLQILESAPALLLEKEFENISANLKLAIDKLETERDVE